MHKLSVDTKTLPECLKSALALVSYARHDISVELVPADNAVIDLKSSSCFEGNRGYTILLNMETGEKKFFEGSWGGSNMFVKTVVDDLDQKFTMPQGCAVIKGESGGRGHFSTIYLRSDNVVPGLLNAPAIDADTYRALRPHCLIGQYKQAAMASIPQALTDAAVAAGLLAKKGRGLGLTTAGKNAMVAYERANPGTRRY